MTLSGGACNPLHQSQPLFDAVAIVSADASAPS
jgi:hypothetical protein